MAIVFESKAMELLKGERSPSKEKHESQGIHKDVRDFLASGQYCAECMLDSYSFKNSGSARSTYAYVCRQYENVTVKKRGDHIFLVRTDVKKQR